MKSLHEPLLGRLDEPVLHHTKTTAIEYSSSCSLPKMNYERPSLVDTLKLLLQPTFATTALRARDIMFVLGSI